MTRRIVITIGRLSVGGAELRLLQIMRTIQEQGLPVQCTVFIVSGEPGPLDGDFKAAGVALVHGRPGLRGLPALWALCRRVKPHALHVNAETAAGFYALAGLLAGVPRRVAHLHSMAHARGRIRALTERGYEIVTNVFCQRIIGVSTGSRRDRLIVRPWQTVYNGITAPTDQELEHAERPGLYASGRVRVVVLGRIARLKHVDRAIRIFARFRERVPLAELHVVGPFVDVPRESLEAVARSAGVADSVVFHGPVRTPAPYLVHASLLLMTSSVEGLPGVVLEALACGTPVVASDVPGAVEIAARTAGVVCRSLGEDDARWAEAMESSLATPREAVRSAFRESLFTTNRFVSEILAVWDVPR